LWKGILIFVTVSLSQVPTTTICMYIHSTTCSTTRLLEGKGPSMA
jgi:hypothetical protein